MQAGNTPEVQEQQAANHGVEVVPWLEADEVPPSLCSSLFAEGCYPAECWDLYFLLMVREQVAR